MSGKLDTLLREMRVFKPSKEMVDKSNIKMWMKKQDIKDYDDLLKKALENPAWFWNQLAGEMEWFQLYQEVSRRDPPMPSGS